MDVYYKLVEEHFPDIDQLLFELKETVLPNFNDGLPFDLKSTDLKMIQINKYVRLIQIILSTYKFSDLAHRAFFVNLLAKISTRYEKCFHTISEDVKLRENGIGPQIEYDEIELAKSTYIIYQCSRDGIGKDFSHAKYKSNDIYLSRILNLYHITERLENVIIVNRNAFDCISMESISDIICEENNYLPDNFKEIGYMYVFRPTIPARKAFELGGT
jgi:hypothetical protein